MFRVDNKKRHITSYKINKLRNNYFIAVQKDRPYFLMDNKLVITKFAKYYLIDLENKYKTLN